MEKGGKNYIEWERVLKIYANMKKSIEKERLEADNISIDYFLLSMLVLFPIRKLNDYNSIKIRNFNTEKDNYVDLYNREIVFNKYKNNKKNYGNQVFEIDEPMFEFLKFWMKDNRGEYLLWEKYSSTFLTTVLV